MLARLTGESGLHFYVRRCEAFHSISALCHYLYRCGSVFIDFSKFSHHRFSDKKPFAIYCLLCELRRARGILKGHTLPNQGFMSCFGDVVYALSYDDKKKISKNSLGLKLELTKS